MPHHWTALRGAGYGGWAGPYTQMLLKPTHYPNAPLDPTGAGGRAQPPCSGFALHSRQPQQSCAGAALMLYQTGMGAKVGITQRHMHAIGCEGEFGSR